MGGAWTEPGRWIIEPGGWSLESNLDEAWTYCLHRTFMTKKCSLQIHTHDFRLTYEILIS
jgi:hypothetical protein